MYDDLALFHEVVLHKLEEACKKLTGYGVGMSGKMPPLNIRGQEKYLRELKM